MASTALHRCLLLHVIAATCAQTNVSVWHVVWTGGQSNSVGTNSQVPDPRPWPTTHRIQMFCWSGRGCTENTFAPAQVPLYNEHNVGFSQTFANLLLPTLPADHGVITINTGVGGTGFHDNKWTVPNGSLTVNSVTAMKKLVSALPGTLGGSFVLDALLWHQGEEDAGDNRDAFNATYCHYLEDDLGALVDFLRAQFPGASAGTPFLAGGMLPYWVDAMNGTATGVMDATYALNTSRACTGTADSRIFPDFLADGQPAGDPKFRSGVSGDVIHFNATMATLMGYQYWDAYHRASPLLQPSARTNTCTNNTHVPRSSSAAAATVAQCTHKAG